MSDSEKFVYIDKTYIALYQPHKGTTKQLYKSIIPYGFMTSHFHHEACIGHNYNKIVLVCRNHEDPFLSVVIKFDSNLKHRGHYYVISHKKHASAIDILESEIGPQTHIQESRHFKFIGDSEMPHHMEIGHGCLKYNTGDGDINKFCYDQYDDSFVIVLGEEWHHIFETQDCRDIEIWKQTENYWTLFCANDKLLDQITDKLKDKFNRIDKTYIFHLECTPNHIIMIIMARQQWDSILYAFILDKWTLKVKHCFPATQIAFCNDRQYVYDSMFQILYRNTKLATPLLKLILSY
jgi:hypothetical protein